MMMQTVQLRKFKRRLSALTEERRSYETHWKEIRDFMLPRRGKHLDNESPDSATRGGKKQQNIINPISSIAHKVATAGLVGGFTSPSRPWFRLGMNDPQLAQFQPVKEWLTVARDRMLQVFAKSNFYGATTSVYGELLAFGTAAMLIDEDFKTVIRCLPLTIGEFFLSLNSQYRPDTLYRRIHMTARQMVQEFGIDRVSHRVKAILETNGETEFPVIHALQPRGEFDPRKMGPDNKAWESVYFEENSSDDDQPLRVGGYDDQSFMVPRWDGIITNPYGDSPAMESLPDVKMLQKIERDKLMGLDKSVNPPLNIPAQLKNQGGASVVPGGSNYYDQAAGGSAQVITPLYMVNPDLPGARLEIEAVEARIERAFFNDIFLAIMQQEKVMTAREVAERSGEKLVMLGPVLERIQAEYLDVVIDRAFSIMLRNGLFPPIPDDLKGQQPKVEYVSVLAQAQKMIGVSAISDTVGFIGNLMAAFPEAGDKLNVDETIDEYSEMVGPPPRIIRSDEDVAQLRAQRAQQQQAQQQQAMASAAVGEAKALAETPVEGGRESALDAILGGIV